MSALQLRILLEHICNNHLHNVYFHFMPIEGEAHVHELRLHIWYVNAAGVQFHRSFGPDGTFVEHENI